MAESSRTRKDRRGRFVPVELGLSGPEPSTSRSERKPGELAPVFEAYLEVQRRRRVSPLTIKTFSYGFSNLQRWLDENGIDAETLTPLDCEHYFGQLLDRISWATTRQHLAYVRAAYGYGVRHGLVDRDPTADVKLGWPPDREPETYSNEQLRAIHTAIQTEREELAFHVLAFAGLRLGEAAGLRWSQIDLERAQMKFEGKGKKFRLVPIHPALERVLREYEPRAREYVFGSIREGRPITAHTLGVGVNDLIDRARVEIDSPTHAFRRTVATVMYEQGVRTRVIERIMGWAPRLMHERHYLRIADESMRQAILTLYHDDPVCDHQHEPAVGAPRPRPLVDLSLELAVLEQLERRYGIEGGSC